MRKHNRFRVLHQFTEIIYDEKFIRGLPEFSKFRRPGEIFYCNGTANFMKIGK